MNSDCYKFRKIIFEKSIFENSISATYIVHLKGNKRLKHIINQLLTYQPTNIVYIVFNKGYKKCNKQKFITNPPLDIVDCYITIFNHAKNLNYNNILVLEDDFIFSKSILDKNIINDINHFIFINNDNEFHYLLGCLPFFVLPYNLNTFQYVISGGAHAIIYSKKYREKILKIDQKKIHDWDLYSWKFINNRYCYYKPLCYQIFYESENSHYWGCNTIFKNIMKYMLFLIKYFLKISKLNKQPEPGFTFFYIFSQIFSFFIILKILLIIKNNILL